MDKKEVYYRVKNVLMTSGSPSTEIKKLINEGYFDIEPFTMIRDLDKIEQNKVFHKEGNVFNHTMLVIDKASELREKAENKEVFMLSALLHDIGKINSTKMKNGKLTSYNHDLESAKMTVDFLREFENEDIIKKVSSMTRYHMQPLYYNKNAKQINPKEIVENTEIRDLYLLNIADRLGRVGVDENMEIEQAEKFLEYLKKQEL